MTITIYNGRSAPELATSADDAVRGINHLTRDHANVRYPGEACQVLGSLASLADRLPQALEQIARLLERWYQAGHLGIDGGPFHDDPAAATSAASRHLHDDAVPQPKFSRRPWPKRSRDLLGQHHRSEPGPRRVRTLTRSGDMIAADGWSATLELHRIQWTIRACVGGGW